MIIHNINDLAIQYGIKKPTALRAKVLSASHHWPALVSSSGLCDSMRACRLQVRAHGGEPTDPYLGHAV